MNFLAHAFLSGSDEETIVGNFIADHVKGKPDHRYSAGILNGITLHRLIDEFTDTHPVVRQSADRLKPSYARYSVVIVDMFYDHLLAKHWCEFSSVPLKKFTRHIYLVMMKHYRILPAKTKRILPFMVADDWMAGYAKPNGLKLALKGMARRTRFESGMDKAVGDLQKDYGLYLEEFRLFFPDLQRKVALFEPMQAEPEIKTIQAKTGTTNFLRRARLRNSHK
ncbi:MAG: ACP phosphodiesterase [Bacteroidales bacterium]|nr:ACP phosphodiesterase [Bacteroidales bacterium]MDZ4204042.1 ACP phosphodiesterase [Bacteroidales bacterium]